MKTLLERWIGKKMNRAKLQRLQRKKLKDILSALKGSIPTEIHRKTLDSENIPNWKATHYRFFLLYGGPFLLKFILPKRLYRHFLHLSIANRILCHSTLALTHTDIANDLLLNFFSKLPELYGESIQSINFHNLIHLSDDVRKMKAALTAYSAFPFENLLGIIKKLIRTPRNPLAQLFRRLSEIYSTSEIMKKRSMLSNRVEISRNVSEIDYSDINIKSSHISVTRPNDIVELSSGTFMKVKRIFCNASDISNVFIEGHELKTKNAFEYPRASSEVGLYICPEESRSCPLRKYSTTSIVRKCFRIDVEQTTYLASLLHT